MTWVVQFIADGTVVQIPIFQNESKSPMSSESFCDMQYIQLSSVELNWVPSYLLNIACIKVKSQTFKCIFSTIVHYTSLPNQQRSLISDTFYVNYSSVITIINSYSNGICQANIYKKNVRKKRQWTQKVSSVTDLSAYQSTFMFSHYHRSEIVFQH